MAALHSAPDYQRLDAAPPGSSTIHSPRTVLRGRAVTESGTIDDATIAVAGGTIVFAGSTKNFLMEQGDRTVSLAPGTVVTPGLVDVHCHGAFGVDFSTADAKDARIAIGKMHALGSTSLVASLVTAPPDVLARQLALLADLVDEGLLAGLHLEGPFLAEARCGAQDPRWLTEPDLGVTKRLIDSARGHLTTMTYAPELPGSNRLVQLLVERGVVPSLGHTACTTAQAHDSLRLARNCLLASTAARGRSRPTVTHLFNAMDPLHHRSPGALTACLRAAKSGNAVVELISDNTHLHSDLVAMMFELVGAANIALVTDSMAAAGLHDGQYRLGPAEVIVSDGTARLTTTGAIAGGTALMLDLVRNIVQAGVNFSDAITAASAVPAEVMGSNSQIGGLRSGSNADLLVLDVNLRIVSVMRHGQWLVGAPDGPASTPFDSRGIPDHG